jgi:pimeloyl-ACP methyl ester carboxylesterase
MFAAMSHQLHRVEYGDGTPLIFIHGFTVDHRLLLPLEYAFTDRPGWRRIYLDLPGHGQTPVGSHPATADAVADTVADVARRLVGETPFAVCGNSFGGQIARDLVARFGDQVLGVTLIAPVVTPRPQRRRGTHQTFHARETALDLRHRDPELVAEFTRTAVDHSPGAWADFNRYVAPGLEVYDREFAARLLRDFDLTTAPEVRFSSFGRPALTITGRQDDAVGYEDQFALLNSYPRMTYVALDRAGHNVHLDQPDLTLALFGDWLDRMA